MTKRVEKKKNTSQKAPKKLKRKSNQKSKKLTSLVSKKKLKIKLTLPKKARSRIHSRPSEGTAYMAMGMLVMSLAVFIITFNTFKKGPAEIASSNVRLPASEKSEVSKPKQSSTKTSEDILEREFDKVRSYSISKKIDFWSSILEKHPEERQIIARLGQGVFIEDIAPLFPEKYDCTTYVETVAALSKSENTNQIVKNLTAIRYRDGNSNYSHRNHFPEADWIPNNQQVNILKDITLNIAQSAGVQVKSESKQIDKLRWLKDQLSRGNLPLALAKDAEKVWPSQISVQVDYISIQDLGAILPHIPNGTVINLVHMNHPRRPVLIGHQGFYIQDGNSYYIRHASTGGKIRTNHLESYIQSLLKQYGPNSNWPLIGVNLNQINASTSASSLRNDSM